MDDYFAVVTLCEVHESLATEFYGFRLQSHFESIQRISDSTTLPSLLPHLKASLFSKVDLSGLTEKLILGKEDPQLLSQRDKLQLWQELKTLSELSPFRSVVSSSQDCTSFEFINCCVVLCSSKQIDCPSPKLLQDFKFWLLFR